MNRTFIIIAATSKFQFFRLRGFGRNSPCGVRGWSRSGFLLQMQIKSFDVERFSCKIHSLKGIFLPSFILQVEIESRFIAKTTPWREWLSNENPNPN